MTAQLGYVWTRFRGFARLRAFWHQIVRRYAYEVCRRCGRPVGLVWHAEDALWQAIEGGPGGIRCVGCFDRDCLEAGVLIEWRPVFEGVIR